MLQVVSNTVDVHSTHCHIRYDLGGVVSILALEGVFTLMQEHNLDYPLFYGKLYALFEPSIFHVKYRSRFFRLADKFLRSTYIPGYCIPSSPRSFVGAHRIHSACGKSNSVGGPSSATPPHQPDP